MGRVFWKPGLGTLICTIVLIFGECRWDCGHGEAKQWHIVENHESHVTSVCANSCGRTVVDAEPFMGHNGAFYFNLGSSISIQMLHRWSLTACSNTQLRVVVDFVCFQFWRHYPIFRNYILIKECILDSWHLFIIQKIFSQFIQRSLKKRKNMPSIR